MNVFWDTIIEPLITKLKPKHIVEIGAETGKNTVNLLKYCKENEATLYSIDPKPQFDVEQLKQDNNDRFIFYKALSLNVIHQLNSFDLVLIDGDHNWYTVYNELKLIEKRCQELEIPFPFIILHDIDWPYGRRDLYYSPDNIPDAFRKPFQKKGMKPGISELKDDGGLNPHLFNAVYENNFQNGVLTAAEDFMKESIHQLEMVKISGFFGLGLVFSEEMILNKKEIISFIETLKTSETLQKYLEKLELGRIEELVTRSNLGLLYNESKLKIEVNQNEIEEQKAQIEEQKTQFESELLKYQEKLDEQKKTFDQEISKYQTEANIQKNAQLELSNIIKRIENSIHDRNREIEELSNTINKIESSIRYRIGEAFIEATKSPIQVLKLPVKLIKLFWESKKFK